MENKSRIEAESNHPSHVGLDICVKLHDLSGLRTVQVTRCWNAHRQIILDLIFVDQGVKDAHKLVVLRNAMSVWWIYMLAGAGFGRKAYQLQTVWSQYHIHI